MKLNEGKCTECPYLGVLIKEKCPRCYQNSMGKKSKTYIYKCHKCGIEIERQIKLYNALCFDCKMKRIKVAAQKSHKKYYPKPRVRKIKDFSEPMSKDEWCDWQYHLIKSGEK